jgi:hypothetical protein
MNRSNRTPTDLLLRGAAVAALLAAGAAAQDGGTPPPPPTQQQPPPPQEPPRSDAAAAPAPAEEPKWSFGVSAFTVNPPDDNSYTATVVRADRDWLHLEGRWNYEDLHTGSLWFGANFDWAKEVELRLVPMIGVVMGDTDGVAPGLQVDAKWKWLGLYSESEYLRSTHDRDEDFIYSWNELTLAPTEWLKFGIAGQRTRAYDTRLSIDRGPMLALSFKRVTGTFYWFNPDKSDSYAMFSLGFSF